MSETVLKTRIVQKHDTEENWLKSVYVNGIKENGVKDNPFIPKKSEIIVFDADETYLYARAKIGDGSKNVIELPFINQAELEALQAAIDSIELTDEKIILNSELKTYYNVGKVTNASGTNPITIGNAGDTLRNVFDNLFMMDAEDPTVTFPSLSLTLSNNSSSLEYGKEVTISATITASTGRFNSSYYFGGYTTNTGVSWSTLNLESTNNTFTAKTSGITSGSSFTVSTISKYYAIPSGGTVKGKASAPNGYTSSGITAKNNLGQDTSVRIDNNTSKQESSEASTSVSAGYVPYTYSLSESLPITLPTTNRSKNKPASISVSGGNANTYLYIFVPSSSSISTIKSGGFGVPFTLVESSKSYIVNNDKATTFKVYKTDSTVVGNTFDIS